ncbi:MAG: DNA-3-methyladenine glycosylase [Mariniblastus sp.]|nr:DNA-3-methyladenine glycosylase [Mariniblastus sp.]
MPFAAQDIRAARLHLQKSDPVLKQIIKQVGPFRCKVNRNRFESLVHSILSQQISGAAAKTIKSRLALATEPDGLTPDALLKFSAEDLRYIGISRQKAGYLQDLAEKVGSGQLKLQTLARREDQAVIDELIQVKGIGVWTAQMFLMFSLARLDVFPVDDLGIRNAISQSYGNGSDLERQELLELGASWSPYATIASWYLWRSLDLPDA